MIDITLGTINYRIIEDWQRNHGYDSEIPEYVLNNREKEYTVDKVVNFEIVAPLKDFKKDSVKLIGNKLVQEVPDPIVLAPVTYEGTKYFLIVSCWGEEASDELVVNVINN
jgi:hypothetical protein